MAHQQEEGWPLGLQPVNVRVVGLVRRSRNFSGSTSLNTILSASPSTSSSDYSTDLDTQSTGSFFRDRSTTLGSLIGVPRIVNLSRRSIRGTSNPESNEAQKNYTSKKWCFSLCPSDTTDAESVTRTTPSLGHFLAVERRAAAAIEHRRSHTSVFYGPHELSLADQPHPESNSLFVNGQIAPPQSNSTWSGSDVNRRHTNAFDQGSGRGVPMMQFPCMCG
ncbi:hypothetical protein ACH5RR_010064 [Cinchona calisaya]|uniref:Uncharacterized protein n=1 Tax=Cinchona calisaya TaxID=153742 RepID=A0ABD3AG68_9GENT